MNFHFGDEVGSNSPVPTRWGQRKNVINFDLACGENVVCGRRHPVSLSLSLSLSVERYHRAPSLNPNQHESGELVGAGNVPRPLKSLPAFWDGAGVPAGELLAD